VDYAKVTLGHIIYHLSGVIFTPTYDLLVTHKTVDIQKVSFKFKRFSQDFTIEGTVFVPEE